jgi:uncharacterized protein YybS (DUF2232 family)
MNSPVQLPRDVMEVALTMSFVALFLSLVALPAITFGVARKWSLQRPEISSAALSGAVAVSIVGILAVAFVVLVLIGWVPPLDQWRH